MHCVATSTARTFLGDIGNSELAGPPVIIQSRSSDSLDWKRRTICLTAIRLCQFWWGREMRKVEVSRLMWGTNKQGRTGGLHLHVEAVFGSGKDRGSLTDPCNDAQAGWLSKGGCLSSAESSAGVMPAERIPATYLTT